MSLEFHNGAWRRMAVQGVGRRGVGASGSKAPLFVSCTECDSEFQFVQKPGRRPGRVGQALG
jgi:hypothetical protein